MTDSSKLSNLIVEYGRNNDSYILFSKRVKTTETFCDMMKKIPNLEPY